MHTKNMQETVLTNSKAEVMLGVLKPFINSVVLCIILQHAFLLCIVCNLSP